MLEYKPTVFYSHGKLILRFKQHKMEMKWWKIIHHRRHHVIPWTTLKCRQQRCWRWHLAEIRCHRFSKTLGCQLCGKRAHVQKILKDGNAEGRRHTNTHRKWSTKITEMTRHLYYFPTQVLEEKGERKDVLFINYEFCFLQSVSLQLHYWSIKQRFSALWQRFEAR